MRASHDISQMVKEVIWNITRVLEHIDRTSGDCMTCMAMYGNGVSTGTTVRSSGMALLVLPRVPIVYDAVVLGSTTPSIAVPLPVTMAARRSRTGA